MGAYKEKAFTKEIRIMESTNKKDNHIKVKICGDVEESLANKIRLVIESYNKQSDKKVSYRITCHQDHRPY